MALETILPELLGRMPSRMKSFAAFVISLEDPP
jgi:hypothetical protein